ncbi:polysaccharide biosynthesis tyrosine autokinase [Micropruina sp.]|uniref:polysaccharide biosynthesis tyrosine autokinase n=1 Tax=Micropruina sp. TaxID=2737536 RepID=UPI0039E404A0
MELRDYVAVLRKYWVSIVAITLIGLVGATMVTLLSPPTYTARSAVFLAVRGGDSASELAQGATYATNQVRSYAQVATTPTVLQPVITKLQLDITPAKLADSVSASIPTNTALIEIAVVDGDPELGARIAQATSEQLVTTVEQLSPADSNGKRAVVATIVTPATIPLEKTTPRTVLNLAVGLLSGLALGFGQSVLRNTLDRSIRTEDDVVRATDHSVIAKVPFDPDAAEHPLVMFTDPHSLRAEAYRKLRTNLQFLQVANGTESNSFVVTSSIAGEGKSTTSINLASTLAEGGKKVLLIDADLRRSTVAKYLNIEGSVGLTTVLIGRAALEDVVQPIGSGGFHVVAAGEIPPNPAELLASDAMRRLLAEVTAVYDIVVIDAAPLLPVTDAAILSTMTGGALIVAGSGVVTVPELEDSVATLDQVNGTTLGIVLNKAKVGNGDGYYYHYKHESAAKGAPHHDRLHRSTRPTKVPAGNNA